MHGGQTSSQPIAPANDSFLRGGCSVCLIATGKVNVQRTQPTYENKRQRGPKGTISIGDMNLSVGLDCSGLLSSLETVQTGKCCHVWCLKTVPLSIHSLVNILRARQGRSLFFPTMPYLREKQGRDQLLATESTPHPSSRARTHAMVDNRHSDF